MALYDAKIERFIKKAEQLERSIKRDTEERRRLLSEITRLRYWTTVKKVDKQSRKKLQSFKIIR